MQVRQRLLKEKEMKIRQALERLRRKRQLLGRQRQRREFPVVSVVGYTNSGEQAAGEGGPSPCGDPTSLLGPAGLLARPCERQRVHGSLHHPPTAKHVQSPLRPGPLWVPWQLPVLGRALASACRQGWFPQILQHGWVRPGDKTTGVRA